MFYKCFTMFNNVLRCLASRTTIGIPDRAAADRLRDRDNAAVIGDNAAGAGDNAAGTGDNAAGIGDNSAEIGDDAAGIVNIAAKVIPCKTLS